MTLAAPTIDEIRDGAIDDLICEIPGAEVEEGGHHYATAVAAASVCAPMYANAAYLARQPFWDTADEEGLKLLGAKYGCPRQGAKAANGTIAVTASYATSIANSTRLSNRTTGAVYKTIGITAITSTLTATASVIAVSEGALGNADAGTTLSFESAPSGINPSATVLAIDGGEAAWTIARWRLEGARKQRRRSGAGNVDHIQELARAVSGVEECFVYPALRGTGTCDVIITTSAASGTRTPSDTLLARVLGAFRYGVRVDGGDRIGPLRPDSVANTVIQAPVEELCDVVVGYKASAQNPFAAWPPSGSTGVDINTAATWYLITASTSLTSFTVTKPLSGTVVAPTAGKAIGVYFDSAGYCKATIASAVDTGAAWTVTTGAWAASDASAPTETTHEANTLITPWCSQLVNIAGKPADDTTQSLSGAVPEYFATLGPGEMTPLTVDDLSRRCRWPLQGETSPITELELWPTDATARLSLSAKTDARNFTISSTPSTPTVPIAPYKGAPSGVLVLGKIQVIPI